LRGGDARKLTVVLRKADGDEVEIVDSGGAAFKAMLVVESGRVRARLTEALAPPAVEALQIVLAQAIPKASKMDYVVEKATELGVARIIPVLTERTAGTFARAGKTERWRRLARSAAQQCGRRDVPEIDEASTWDEFCTQLATFDRTLIPWELAEPVPLRDRLPGLLAGVRSAAIAIGPEGGFSHAEVERATDSGAVTISLGRRILRTETAGLVVCGILRYATGDP
jgi:16S rRNA (uracil1498-N3)-methyltransferase